MADGQIELAWAEAPNLQLETRRDHADDGVASSVECNAFADDARRRAKLAAPELRADEHEGACADLVFSLRKESSDDGLHAEQLQVVRGNKLRSDLLRVTCSREVERGFSRHAHRGKGAVIFAPVSKIREGDRS